MWPLRGRRFALLLAVIPAAHAQVGGIVKKKVTQKVTNKPDTTATAAAAAKPKCDATSAVITSSVVDNWLKSLAARDAQLKKLAKEPGPTGAYYAALLKRQAIQERKDQFELHKGPDWAKQQALHKRLMAGDGTAIQEQQALSDSINPNRVQLPELDWASQQKSSAQIDSVMRVAGGFDACDWLDLSERVPRLVYMLANDPNTTNFQGFGTAKEASAIKPKIAELAHGMQITYVSPADQARLKKEKEDAEASPELPSTGDPQMDCVNKFQMNWTKTHQAELDAAQKSQDPNVLVKLSMQMQQEAMAKCMPSQ